MSLVSSMTPFCVRSQSPRGNKDYRLQFLELDPSACSPWPQPKPLALVTSSPSTSKSPVSSSPSSTLLPTTFYPPRSWRARRDWPTRVGRFVVFFSSERRLFADRLAASPISLSTPSPSLQAEKIKARFNYAERGPRGVDLVIDCTGAEICVQTALYLLKHGGTYVQVGSCSSF